MKNSLILLLLLLVGCQSSVPTPPMPPIAQQSSTTSSGQADTPATNTALIFPPPPSNPVVSFTLQPPGQYPGTAWVLIQATTDFTNWVDLGTMPDTAGPASFKDTNNLPYRFYRVIVYGSYDIVTNVTIQ